MNICLVISIINELKHLLYVTTRVNCKLFRRDTRSRAEAQYFGKSQMATRIVEHQLSWCEARITELLVQSGYTVVASNSEERKLKLRYTGADKQKMLLRQRAEVTLTPLSNRETCVYFGFQLRWLAYLALGCCWLVIGIAPHVIMMDIAN